MKKKLNLKYLSLTLVLALIGGCNSEQEKDSEQEKEGTITKSSNGYIDIYRVKNRIFIPQTEALVQKKESIVAGDTFTFTDIEFQLKSPNEWKIINRTPQPLDSLIVKLNDNELHRLKINDVIDGYSSADLYIPFDMDIYSIDNSNQFAFFLPIVSTGGYVEDCKEDACLDDLNNDERQNYLAILSKFRESLNRRSYLELSKSFFDEHCDEYSDCVNYDSSNLDYSTNALIIEGMSKRTLYLKALRDNGGLTVDGRGGGTGFHDVTSIDAESGWGYASLNEENTNPSPAVHNILMHEIGHAYGFMHDSGLTYGLAEEWGYHYVPDTWTEDQRKDISKLQLPAIASEIVEQGKGVFLLKLYNTISENENVDIEVICVEPVDYSIEETSAQNEFKLTIKSRIQAPIYIRSTSESSDYISTLKIIPDDVYHTLSLNSQDELTHFNDKITGWLTDYDEIYIYTKNGQWTDSFYLPSDDDIEEGKMIQFSSTATSQSSIYHDDDFDVLTTGSTLKYFFNGLFWEVI